MQIFRFFGFVIIALSLYVYFAVFIQICFITRSYHAVVQRILLLPGIPSE